jgi:hypothetical protein
VAAACGYYDFNNYFYYLFYHCLSENWPNEELGFFDKVLFILNTLGLTIKTYHTDNPDEFISLIKSTIDKHSMVILPAVYIYLFYFPQYRNNATTHFLMVSGYDPKRSAIQIRDTIQDFVITPGLYKIQMHESLLKEIWINSNNFFKERNPRNYNMFYSIEKTGESKVSSYIDVTKDFLSSYNPENSKLANIVEQFPKLAEDIKKNELSSMLYLKRELCHTTAVLFDCFSYMFNINNRALVNELHTFKGQYINFRERIVTKMHAEALRNRKSFSIQERENIKNEILLKDRRLFSLIQDILRVQL